MVEEQPDEALPGARQRRRALPVPMYPSVRKRLTQAVALLLVVLALSAAIAGDNRSPTISALAGTSRQEPSQPRTSSMPAILPQAQALQPLALTQYVNPFVGTRPGGYSYGYGGGGGNTYPGATLPFGMVQWSPDTSPGPVAGDSGGYLYDDPAIKDFSLTHISGAGCKIFGDVPFMPTTLPVTDSPSSDTGRYSASFSHARESATPGNYSVQLGTGIDASLTATLRTGFARLQYPAGQPETLLIESGSDLGGVFAARAQIVSPTELVGSVTSGHFCGYLPSTYTLYFAVEFSRPVVADGAWQGGELRPGARQADGPGSGIYVSFAAKSASPLLVKAGVSYVSAGNALANIAAENPGWNFETVSAAAQATWNTLLNRIQAQGGSPAEERVFYTALYHAALHPNTFSDVNGQYIGFDGRVHTAANYVQYANFSGWDIYRTEIPLLALIAPSRTSDMMQSLVADAQQGGGLPRWALANVDTGIMVGDPLSAAIASAYAFGARAFDTSGALSAMLAGANRPGIGAAGDVERPGLAEYLSDGFVPDNAAYVAASTSLEYYAEDDAVANFAWALRDSADARALAARAARWPGLYNPVTGYMGARGWAGAFTEDSGPTTTDGFLEGDAAQYTWMVPFDVGGLVARMGGSPTASRRLDVFLSQLNAGPFAPYAFMGNEPSLDAPWEYDYMGQPWKTQATVRRVLTQLYRDGPDGLPGNDDLGTLSAWYVWGALGLYPLIPGDGGFVLGSPLFPRTTLTIDDHLVTLQAPGAGQTTPYIHELYADGRSYSSLWLTLATLQRTTVLTYALGSSPDPTWAADPHDAPPSLSATTWPAVPPDRRRP